MDNKKLAELMQDKDFMKKILEAATEEEVKKLFSERGVELGEGDIELLAKIISQAAENEGKLSEKDLENISGGEIIPNNFVFALPFIAVEKVNRWWKKLAERRIKFKHGTAKRKN